MLVRYKCGCIGSREVDPDGKVWILMSCESREYMAVKRRQEDLTEPKALHPDEEKYFFTFMNRHLAKGDAYMRLSRNVKRLINAVED